MSARKLKPIADYKIGDEMFRYVEVGGVFRYIVDGRREYNGAVQLEVECQTCSHGWKCRLLLAQDDWGRIVHVHMLNEDEDDPQRHWHATDGLHFWPTANEAKQEQLRRMIRQAEESVRKAEDSLAAAKKRLGQFKDLADETSAEIRKAEEVVNGRDDG